MTRWEYATITDDDADNLNDYGKDGWEAFAVVPHPYSNEPCYVWFFKRALPDERVEFHRARVEEIARTGTTIPAISWPGKVG
jgi:hypothetical protein